MTAEERQAIRAAARAAAANEAEARRAQFLAARAAARGEAVPPPLPPPPSVHLPTAEDAPRLIAQQRTAATARRLVAAESADADAPTPPTRKARRSPPPDDLDAARVATTDAPEAHLHELFASAFCGTRDAALAFAIAAGEPLDEEAAKRAGRQLLALDSVRAAIRRHELDMARAAMSQRAHILGDIRTVYERCMQARPVYDARGQPTGEWRFEPAVALRALELAAKLQGLQAPTRLHVRHRFAGPPAPGATPETATMRLVEDATT